MEEGCLMEDQNQRMAQKENYMKREKIGEDLFLKSSYNKYGD